MQPSVNASLCCFHAEYKCDPLCRHASIQSLLIACIPQLDQAHHCMHAGTPFTPYLCSCRLQSSVSVHNVASPFRKFVQNVS